MTVINALGPVFLLMMLGVLFRRIEMPGRNFWPLAERITYYVFFPALLVHSLATAPFTAVELGRIFVIVLLLLLPVAALLLLAAPRLAPTGAAFTSVFQGAIRLNTYVGFAAAAGLWGQSGLATAAIVVACLVPVVNLLCIAVFALKVGTHSSFARQVVLNPLIMACLIGIALNLAHIGLPGWSDPLLEILGRPALPVGLLAIGVGLSYDGLRPGLWPVIASSTVKLLLMPVLAFILCRGVNLDSPYAEVLILLAALPTASSAYILSRQLAGDAPLMATIITLQTIVAMATLPLVLYFLIPV